MRWPLVLELTFVVNFDLDLIYYFLNGFMVAFYLFYKVLIRLWLFYYANKCNEVCFNSFVILMTIEFLRSTRYLVTRS